MGEIFLFLFLTYVGKELMKSNKRKIRYIASTRICVECYDHDGNVLVRKYGSEEFELHSSDFKENNDDIVKHIVYGSQIVEGTISNYRSCFRITEQVWTTDSDQDRTPVVKYYFNVNHVRYMVRVTCVKCETTDDRHVQFNTGGRYTFAKFKSCTASEVDGW